VSLIIPIKSMSTVFPANINYIMGLRLGFSPILKKSYKHILIENSGVLTLVCWHQFAFKQ